MGIISWVIFGALAGWLASIITGRNQRMGCLANIVVGIIGAFIGGVSGFNLYSFVVAVLGAVVLLVIVGFFQRR